jgi:two-component system, NtrC family, sensor kinase
VLRVLFPPSLGPLVATVRAEVLARALTDAWKSVVEIDVAHDYGEIASALRDNAVDIAWAPPEVWEGNRDHAHAVVEMVRENHSSYSAAIVTLEEGPDSLDALKGARAAWVDPQSKAGYLLPIGHIEARGYDPARVFASQRFCGSYLDALEEVLAGRADVTAIYSHVPDVHAVIRNIAECVGDAARRFRVMAFTAPTRNDGLVIGKRLSAERARRLVDKLVDVNSDAPERRLLLDACKAERFVMADVGRLPETPHAAAPRQALSTAVVDLDPDGAPTMAWSDVGAIDLGSDPLADAIAPAVAFGRRSAEQGRSARLEYATSVGADHRWYSAQVLLGEGGSTRVVVRDITHDRAGEARLRELASFPLFSPQVIVEADATGHLTYANPAARESLGPEWSREGAQRLVSAARTSLDDGGTGECSVGDRWYDFAARKTQTGHLRVYARDVTARKHAERAQRDLQGRMLEADRLAVVGTLAAGVAHEINNPLAFITTNQELALELIERGDVGSNDELRDLIREALVGTRRISSVVRDLRTYAQPESSRDATSVDLTTVVKSAASIIANEIRHRARLVLDHGAVPRVVASESRLSQVVLNLLINAAQAIEPGHVDDNRIVVRTAVVGDMVELRISDTGGGIPKAALERVYDPFFTTKPQGVGTGLGLSICRSIVDGLGGTIDVESLVGLGTTVRVQLPSAPGDAVASTPLAEEAALRAKRVLIIDDEIYVGRAMKRVLGHHDVQHLDSAREALEQLSRDDRFDLILCDLMMPDVDGEAFYRALEPWLAERVVFMTGGAFTERSRDFLASVDNVCLDKPVSAAELRAFVDGLELAEHTARSNAATE